MICYLTIVGARQGKFKGETSAAGHQDAMEAVCLDYTLALPIDSLTGQITGRVAHRPLRFIKKSGAATPQLLKALLDKEQLTTVTIQFVSAAADTITIESIVITNATIVELRHHFGTSPEVTPGSQLLDEVALTYQKVEVHHPPAATSATDIWQTPT